MIGEIKNMKNKLMKTELEEAAEKFYPPKTTDLICSPKLVRDSFIAGAKWQQEQNKNLYSEEEVINALHSVELRDNKDYSKIYSGMKEWFEQFKKK